MQGLKRLSTSAKVLCRLRLDQNRSVRFGYT